MRTASRLPCDRRWLGGFGAREKALFRRGHIAEGRAVLIGGGPNRPPRRSRAACSSAGAAGQRALAAERTCATWPGTLTLRQTWRMTPSPSIRKVERSTPMYWRPYMLF